MPETFDHRRETPDRRQRPRGGRRTTDQTGFTPLVMVVDDDPHRRDTSDAILAKLHFAVAPMDSVEKALGVIETLKPDVIVVRAADAAQLRARIPQAADGDAAPVVVVSDDVRQPEVLVEEIRRSLRARREPESS